jgi:hypothetical protein
MEEARWKKEVILSKAVWCSNETKIRSSRIILASQ